MTALLTAAARPKLCLGETHDALFSVFVWFVSQSEFSDCQSFKSIFEKNNAHAFVGSQNQTSKQ
jgi:hypothetical protein